MTMNLDKLLKLRAIENYHSAIANLCYAIDKGVNMKSINDVELEWSDEYPKLMVRKVLQAYELMQVTEGQ